jgi:tRNA(Arg) A34 adenosine deaminase TadA
LRDDPGEEKRMAVTEEQFMRAAIEKAREGIAAGQSPFGSVIVCDGKIVSATHNTVWRDGDPTAHAEVNNIRAAARALSTIDLSGCDLYTTCEPCPMCLSAIHWAKIRRVVFGASIADAAAVGFSELRMEARRLAEMGGSPLRVEAGLLTAECRALFEEFRRAGKAKTY